MVNDAVAVLAGIAARYSEDKGLVDQASHAVALLALVAERDVEPAGGSDGRDGRWRIGRKVDPLWLW